MKRIIILIPALLIFSFSQADDMDTRNGLCQQQSIAERFQCLNHELERQQVEQKEILILEQERSEQCIHELQEQMRFEHAATIFEENGYTGVYYDQSEEAYFGENHDRKSICKIETKHFVGTDLASLRNIIIDEKIIILDSLNIPTTFECRSNLEGVVSVEVPFGLSVYSKIDYSYNSHTCR